jgi:uncharacterized protein (TIGR02246 family)
MRNVVFIHDTQDSNASVSYRIFASATKKKGHDWRPGVPRSSDATRAHGCSLAGQWLGTSDRAIAHTQGAIFGCMLVGFRIEKFGATWSDHLSGGSTVSVTNDEQAIKDLYAQWRQATLSEDVHTLLGLIADDAVFYVPGQPPMRGKKDFKDVFDSIRGKFSFEWQSEFDEIAIHGDWAHVASRLAVIMKPRSGGPAQHQAGYTLTILRKDKGRWLVFRDANLLAPEPAARPTSLAP